MKRLLITGEKSYVGNSLKKWIQERYVDEISVSAISVRNERWKEVDFKKYDVIVHVAGIAHIKETKKIIPSYYMVNRDLAFEIAKKAKKEGVKQFILMSSMSVYGLDNGIIDSNTVPNPTSNYGKSKLAAEKLIAQLAADNFKCAFVRAPMIYGENSPGNYNKLKKIAVMTPVFPNYMNYRSMIYINNLTEFLVLLILNNSCGVFCPQNKELINTFELVKCIRRNTGKKTLLVSIFNPLISILIINNKLFSKVFGSLIYDLEISKYKDNYFVDSFEESIKKSL